MSAETSTATRGFLYFDVKPVDGLVEIVRQGSNFFHKEGSGYAGYYVGSPANIRQMTAVTQMFTSINIGLYLCLFLLHMILYLILRSYRANLWFSLLCLTWLMRAGFTGRFVYTSMFPGIPWAPVYKLGCVSVAFSGILLLLLVMDQFPGIVQKWPMRILVALQVLPIPVCFFADTVTVSYIKVVSEVMLYVAAVYLIVRFIMVLPKQIRHRKLLPEQVITLIGVGVALFVLIHDAMRYNNIPVPIHYEIGDVGILVLVLLQMVAMVLGTLRQLTEARQDAQIAWESAEIARKSEQLAMLQAENLQKDLELQMQLIADTPKESLITCGPLTLNIAAGQAYLRNEDMLLTPKDFSLLYCFVQHVNEIASREQLHEEAWMLPLAPKDRALDSSVYRLRKKLSGSGYGINTVRGKGFCFENE